MKKLIFIVFFPITIPIYLLYKFFVWIGDTFIPFLQFDIFPLFTDKFFPAIKRYLKEKSTEMERNADTHKKAPEQNNSDVEHKNISANSYDSNDVLEKITKKDSVVNNAFQNVDVREKTKMNIEPIFQEAFYQYHEIDYEKKSTIVSIFTNKWRTICQKQFIVLDFETTGLSYVNDRIIEIAAIKYENGIETDKFVHLVNPLMPIPAEATAINKITDEMVANADTERYLIPQLIEFLSDSLIVGHNVNFDLHFLEAAAQRYGYNVQYNYIDTISVSKKIFPGLPNYKLTTIADSLGFKKDNMHRAETDVRVCAEIINIALNSLSQ